MSVDEFVANQIAEQRAVAQTLTLPQLRRLWAQNRRETRAAIYDPLLFQGWIMQRREILIPEFERRGYRCVDPANGMILDMPRKATD